MSKTIFTIIGWLSVVTIPVAPAYFFGEAVMQQASKHASYTLAVIVGICAAAGMEGVGIYSGHTAVQAFRLGRWYLGSFAAAILAAYVIIGASKLTGFGQTMFFVAPLSYLILGINHAVEVAEEREKAAEEQAKKQADSNRELEQQREKERRKEEADMAAQQRAEEADRVARRDQLAAERQARLDAQNAEKERLAHEERMAKIAAKNETKITQSSPKITPELSHTKRHKSTLTPAEKAAIAQMETGEIVATFGVKPRVAQLWRVEFAPPVTAGHSGVSAD
jgi:flagellar biosynthesis GTPase FlhF